MFFYLMLLLTSLASTIFFGAIIVMSIMSIIGIKYESKISGLVIWGLIMLFLAFVTRIVYLG